MKATEITILKCSKIIQIALLFIYVRKELNGMHAGRDGKNV
jgi:hypothetical protein